MIVLKKAEALIALVLFCVGGGAFYVAYTQYGEGTEVAPMIYSGALCLLSLMLFFVSLRSSPDKENENGEAGKNSKERFWKFLIVTAAIDAYILLIQHLGFYCSTWLFLALFMILSRATTLVKALIIATLVTAALWLFFDIVLLVPTPRGLLI